MEKSSGSRLLQMQARFQQKQMQERELKIASLYEAQQARALDRVRHSPGSGGGASAASSPPQPPPPTVPHHPGKVRQMFEERRTKAGIDKSYPLQPIHNTDRLAKKGLTNGHSKVTAVNTRASVERRTVKTHTTTHTVKKQQHKIENIVNGSGDLNHNHEPDLNTEHVLPRSNGEVISHTDQVDRADNNYLLEDETFPDALAPAPTPRSPEPEPKKPPRRSPATKTNTPKAKPQTTPVAPPRRVTSDNTVTDSSKPRGAMQRTASTAVPPKQRQSASPAASKPRAGAAASSAEGGCAVCGRRFAPDRLAKHQDICRKAHATKRKPFDVLKHRLAGTEAEQFISKLRKQGGGPAAAAGQGQAKAAKPAASSSSWRRKHEEFIQAIRAAKQVQAHLNAGGKLSDLPPPPPSENPDYVQCPHCSRRFNQAAADRHIPKCASYQFNKTKPNARRR